MIYLDHNATTSVLPEVLEEMWPLFTEKWGNASSSYRFGSQMKGTLETARGRVASLIGANSREVIFTGCATESNNAAIHAALLAYPERRHIVSSKVEHSSVLQYVQAMEKTGYRVTYLGVDQEGLLDLTELEAAISTDTVIVSLMWANNETGVLFPVKEISEICRKKNVLFHCDAVQAAGKIAIDLRQLPVDYLSLAGHKIGAPKGVGALYVNRKAPFSPYLFGGHQERGKRGGTENIALIAGLGKASEIASKSVVTYEKHVGCLRDSLEEGLNNVVPNMIINGQRAPRLSNTSSLTLPDFEAEALLLLLDNDGICASSGSACLADSDEPSHVIIAMRPDTQYRQTLRFSLGNRNTLEDIRQTIESVKRATETLSV